MLNSIINFINSKQRILNSTFNKLPEFKTFIIENTQFLNVYNISLLERLWYVINNIKSPILCKTCNKKATFINLKNGYRDFCSAKCAMSNIETRKKIQNTFLKNYGVDNPWKNKEIIKKCKNTLLENTGYSNPTQNPTIKEKIKQTCIERYRRR